jgi:hypothetical protein
MDVLEQVRDLDEGMNVSEANATIARTMDAIIRKEKISQMLDRDH